MVYLRKQLNSIEINEINNNSLNKEDRESLIKQNNYHINWAEKDKLIHYNLEKELLFQDEITNIT